MFDTVSESKSFAGWYRRLAHTSEALGCRMHLGVYLPPQAKKQKVPILYWLSGLTCTDENFAQKAHAMHTAAELGIALVIPDTSPRGDNVADDASYDFGQGASFYVDAKIQPWAEHFQMYSYITQELPNLIEKVVPFSGHRSISGHSMGGHGALMIALRNPHRYRSASAFSPICHPSQSFWGKKALAGYLGEDKGCWARYDSTLLIQSSEGQPKVPLLVDQGDQDPYLQESLQPDYLLNAVNQTNYPCTLRMQPGYDHSYYFVASFMADHLRFHADYL